ncbi:MAG: ABC transporter permease subunit [Acidiferrobacter sp.]
MLKRWARTFALICAALILLYPLFGLLAPVGDWQWHSSHTGRALATSFALTGAALVFVVLVGTPLAWSLRSTPRSLRLGFEAAVLLSVLMPPLALGLLLVLAFGPTTPVGAFLLSLGIPTSNSAIAFIATQVYASFGYYLLAATVAFDSVPKELEQSGALLGLKPWEVFRRITLPLARLGLATAMSLAWVRALGEFGAIMVTAYYPHGMPVQLWVNLQDGGLPAVMPLLAVFLLTALPLPWALHLFSQQRSHA